MSNIQENDLIKKALILETHERTQFLNKIKDKGLIQKILFLLDDDQAATQFVFKTSIDIDLSTNLNIKDLNAGDKIKQFTIIRLLAKGGMGSVYLAYDGKLKRSVAIKTIRSEYIKNAASLQRFKREAQILSQINHPSICQIYEYIDYEGGDVLVLELVKGKTLNVFTLDDKQKFDVFVQIASALVVAHDLDVIHRDLKPDNIMLTNENMVKVLDFGIAKSNVIRTQNEDKEPQKMPENIKLTKLGTMMGTLLYMSPEQAAGQQVTKASDIYSLGIIMHEILTGVKFYDFSNADELRKQVLNANNINADLIPRKFQSLIKALTQKQPQARPRAIEVAAILNEIKEKPKRRIKQITIITILIISILGFSKYTYDLNQQKIQAELAREESEQVTEFLESLFRVSDPYSKQGETITARQMLDDGAKRIDNELKDQPRALVKLKMVIGEVYRKMGLYQSSRKQFREALNLIGDDHINNVELKIKLLGLVVTLEYETENYDEMESLVNTILQLSESNNLTDKDQYLSARFNRAAIYDERGDKKKATEEFESLLSLYLIKPEHYKNEIVTVYNSLGIIHADAGEPLIAKDYLEKGLLLLSSEEDEDLELKSVLLGNLATIFNDMGQNYKAIDATLSIIKLRKKLFDEVHPLIALGYKNLANSYCKVKEFEKCLSLNGKALNIYRQTTGEKSISYALTLVNKATYLGLSDQKYLEAEPVFLEALDIITSIHGEQHILVANLLTSLGNNYYRLQKFQKAQEKFHLAINIFSKLEQPMNGTVVDAWYALAMTYEKQDNLPQALRSYKDMLVKLENEKNKDKKLIAEIQQKISDLN